MQSVGSNPTRITKYGGYRQGGKLGLNPRGTGNCTDFDYSILRKNMESIWLDEGPVLKTGSSEKSGLWVRVPRSPQIVSKP